MTPEIHVLPDEREAAVEAADLFVWLANEASQGEGRFRVALSGGSTPQGLHRRLAGPDFAPRVKWPQVEFYFGDERCVPSDHPESNYGMAKHSLFDPLRIPGQQVFRMPGELPDPDEGARRYEKMMRERMQTPSPAWPSLDLIFLGLGEDGHTASLFPRAPVLAVKDRAVASSRSPKGVPNRITFTVPLINQARMVLFYVLGMEKAQAVRRVLEDETVPGVECPAKLIRPEQGRLVWMLDRAAASELKSSKRQVPSDEE